MGLLSSSATAIFSSCFILPFQNERPFSFSLPQTHFSTPLMAKPVASPSPHTSSSSRQHKKPSLLLTKRIFSLSSILLNLTMPTTITTISSAMAEEQQRQLERYTDINEDFTLLKPSSWIKVDKAGATVLFEEANKGANNVGIVVTPVRLNTLRDFGTPQFVAEKLIQAEKLKESTKDAEVIGVAERSGHGGLQVYEFEYKVDSTRGGMKRIFSAAFVSSKKLYLLNIAYSDRPENPLDSHTRMMLEQVLHSFDTASST